MSTFSLPNTYSLLMRVPLARPKIIIDALDVHVTVSRAGTGRCWLLEGQTLLGEIRQAGLVDLRVPPSPAAGVLLAILENDPADVARLHGQRTGRCCFCRKPLITNESVTMGYGPVCADNWGLPWGMRATAEEIAAEKREMLR